MDNNKEASEEECCRYTKGLVKEIMIDQSNWDHITKKAGEHKPDLIVITFDCKKCGSFNTVRSKLK